MIEKLLKEICEAFKQRNYHVLFYRSKSTNSVYIKLDYGVAHTITIRDHKGKAKYEYTHNVFINIDSYEKKGKRYYYSPNDIDLLIENVEQYKDYMLDCYGEERYKIFMKRNKSKGEQERGFWQFCKEW